MQTRLEEFQLPVKQGNIHRCVIMDANNEFVCTTECRDTSNKENEDLAEHLVNLINKSNAGEVKD